LNAFMSGFLAWFMLSSLVLWHPTSKREI